MSYSNNEILETLQDHPGLEVQITPGKRIAYRLQIPGSAGAVAFYLIDQTSKHADRLQEFIDFLAVGNVSKRRDPILILRDGIKDRKIMTKRGGSVAPVSAAIILA